MKKSTQAWLEFADRDLEAARKLLDDEYIANIVLFHSQQCVEKSLKAVLEEYDQKIPRIHSVTRLYALIAEHTNVILPITADELDFIDDVYIDTRYPSNFGLLPSGFPQKSESKKLFDTAEKLYTATMKRLSRDLNQYPFEIRPLTAEEGGGFLISFPDFSECISDGATTEEAIKNGLNALQETIAALESMRLPVPEPNSN